MFPTNSACGWAGMGNVGGSNTKAWINGQFNLKTVGHEIGHNYGLRHAHGLDCDVSAFGNTCTSLPYGDAADLMGNLRTGHFSPFAKEQLGWLNDGVSPAIHTASSSGRYSIEPYSSSSVGPKAIKVPRGVDSLGRKTWYYLEYRQLVGGDTVLNSGNLTTGLVVRTATEGDGDSSYQIDMSPASSTYSNVELTDGALALGQTYTDAVAKVSFTLASADANGATLDVVVNGSTPAPTCTRAAPTLSLVGPTAAVAAGSTVSYTLSLSNRDSSACTATTFNLARSIPSGWTGTLAASTLSLSPGASGSTTLTVTSPATASAGSYGIGAGASSSVGSAHTANASTTYSVASAPTSGTLTETVGTDKSQLPARPDRVHERAGEEQRRGGQWRQRQVQRHRARWRRHRGDGGVRQRRLRAQHLQDQQGQGRGRQLRVARRCDQRQQDGQCHRQLQRDVSRRQACNLHRVCCADAAKRRRWERSHRLRSFCGAKKASMLDRA